MMERWKGWSGGGVRRERGRGDGEGDDEERREKWRIEERDREGVDRAIGRRQSVHRESIVSSACR